jgi:hypothetical protein
MNRAENIFNFRRINMHGTKSGPNADPDYRERYHPGPAQKDLVGYTDVEWAKKKARELKNQPIGDRIDKFMSEYWDRTEQMMYAHDDYGNPIMRSGYPEERRMDPDNGVAINLYPFQWDYEGEMMEGIQVSEVWRLEPAGDMILDAERVAKTIRFGLDLADKYHLPIIAGAQAFDPNRNDDLIIGRDYPTTAELVDYYKSFGFVDTLDINMGVIGDEVIYLPGATGPNR